MADELAEKSNIAEQLGAGDGAAARSTNEPADKVTKQHADGTLERLTVRESIKRAQEELAEKEKAASESASTEEDVDKKPKDTAESELAPKNSPPQDEKPADGKPTADAAPESWTKEERNEWATLSPAAKKAVLRREADAKKGVEELKSRYSKYDELDAVIAPHRPMIAQTGNTDVGVVKALFDWNLALANPKTKLSAFKELAKNFSVDLTSIAPNAGQQPTPQAQDAPNNELATYIEPLQAKVDAQATELARLQAEHKNRSDAAANQALADFAKDRPYFERVRGDMKRLLDMDMAAAQRGLPAEYMPGGTIDLVKLYETACYMKSDVRAELEAERADKTAKDLAAKQQTEAARKALEVKRAKDAAVSVRSGSPGSPANGSQNPGKPRSEGVRDSIRRSLEEVKTRK